MFLNHALCIDKLHRDLPVMISRLLSSRWEETTSPMVAESLADLAGIGGRYSWKSQSSSPAEDPDKESVRMCGFPREAYLRAGSGGEPAPWDTNAHPVAMVEVREVNSGSQRQDTPSKSHHWSNVFSQPCQGCGLSWGDENRLHLNSNLAHCAHMTLDYHCCCCCYFPYLCVSTRIILLEMSNLVQTDTLKHFFFREAQIFFSHFW